MYARPYAGRLASRKLASILNAMALPKFDHPWVNEIHTPIYIVHGPDHPTDEEVLGYIKRLDEWTLIARDPYSWVVFPVHLSPSQRKLMADAQSRRRMHMIKNQRSLA